MMLFELMRTVYAGLVLVGLIEEGAANVFAFRFHVLMALLMHHRTTAGTFVALQTDAINEIVTL